MNNSINITEQKSMARIYNSHQTPDQPNIQGLKDTSYTQNTEQTGACGLSRKAKIIIIGVSIAVVVIALGLGLGLGLGLKKKVKVNQIGPISTAVSSTGDAYSLAQYSVQVDNVFSEDESMNIIANAVQYSAGTRRLLQNSNQVIQVDYYYNDEQLGIIYAIRPNGTFSIDFDIQKIKAYIASQQEDVRLLEQNMEVSADSVVISDDELTSSLNEYLNQQYTDELGNNSLQVQARDVIVYAFNESSGMFQPEDQTVNTTRRMLVTRNLGNFFTNAIRKVASAIKSGAQKAADFVQDVVVPVVNSVAGANIGGKLAGPVGAIIGSQTGQAITAKAQQARSGCKATSSTNTQCVQSAIRDAVKLTIPADTPMPCTSAPQYCKKNVGVNPRR